MSIAAAARNRYAQDSVTTASPARFVTMLYDRLLRDLTSAEVALSGRDLEAAHHQLVHAQDIVQELANSLDLSVWPAGEGLAQLYAWLLEQLLEANVTKNVEVVTACRGVVEPLRDAWHEAANTQVALP